MKYQNEVQEGLASEGQNSQEAGLNVAALLVIATPIAGLGTYVCVEKFGLFWLYGIPIFSILASVVVPLLAGLVLFLPASFRPRLFRAKADRSGTGVV